MIPSQSEIDRFSHTGIGVTFSLFLPGLEEQPSVVVELSIEECVSRQQEKGREGLGLPVSAT